MPTESKLHLRIATPCKAPWENMDGDERVRFCRECNRNVYDLSAMTNREARRVVAEREGRLCVRFYRRRDGTVLTSDCPVAAKRSFFRASAGGALALAGLAAAATPISACDSSANTGTADPDPAENPDSVIMGDIAVSPEPPLMGRIAPPNEEE